MVVGQDGGQALRQRERPVEEVGGRGQCSHADHRDVRETIRKCDHAEREVHREDEPCRSGSRADVAIADSRHCDQRVICRFEGGCEMVSRRVFRRVFRRMWRWVVQVIQAQHVQQVQQAARARCRAGRRPSRNRD